jgi:hypothetical protein
MQRRRQKAAVIEVDFFSSGAWVLLLDVVGASVAPRSWAILASGGRRNEDLAIGEVNSALWREAQEWHLHHSCRMYYA